MSDTVMLRSAIAYATDADLPQVDREAGIIRNVAIATEGEAKGHGVHLDADFIRSVHLQGASRKRGVKARFGHPTMSGSAIGTYLGRFMNFSSTGGAGSARARADLHLDDSARKTPHGDLYDYVLTLAENAPDQFGASIAFTAAGRYQYQNGMLVEDEDAFDDGLPTYVALQSLHAADLVDDPAANPDGLFSATTIAGQVAEYLDANPHVYELLAERPEVVEGFLERYQDYLERKESGGQPAGPPCSSTAERQRTMTEQELQQATDQARAEGLAEGEEVCMGRLSALREAFPGRPDFIVEQFEKGHDVTTAKAELADILAAENMELAKARDELEARLQNAATGTADQPDGDDEGLAFGGEPKTDFISLSEAYRDEHKVTMTAAMSAIAKAHPEAHRSYVQG